jgi:hypothetical protein
LKSEIEALRRHLALALGELKNPIILPPPQQITTPELESRSFSFGSENGLGLLPDGEENSMPVHEDDHSPQDSEDDDDDSDSGFDEGHDDFAVELQEEAKEFLKDLGMFRKKVGTDVERFLSTNTRTPLDEIVAN